MRTPKTKIAIIARIITIRIIIVPLGYQVLQSHTSLRVIERLAPSPLVAPVDAPKLLDGLVGLWQFDKKKIIGFRV